MGKELVHKKLNIVPGLNQENIDVSNLSKGTYFLMLSSHDSRETQKIIIK